MEKARNLVLSAARPDSIGDVAGVEAMGKEISRDGRGNLDLQSRSATDRGMANGLSIPNRHLKTSRYGGELPWGGLCTDEQ